MRLWLLLGLAAALALAAVADHDDPKKLARRREGTSRHRTHRPCSGCFSVLSEESQPMTWREDDGVQPAGRESSRMEEKEPAKPLRHPSRGAVPGQEVPSARMTRRGRGGQTQP